MTHDELTKLIRTGNEFAGIKYAPDSHTFALRAVVELHTPEQEIGGGCDENGEELWVCTHCPDGDGFQDYPCPTIRAIEEAVQL